MLDRLHILDLGLCEYQKAWDIQKSIHEKVSQGLLEDVLIFVEHPPVLTLGKHGTESNLKFSREWLKKHGIPVVRIDRGGEVTAHMPGQLVAYPIVNLSEKKLGVRKYICSVEESIIMTLNHFQLSAARHPDYPGVWVNNQKIAAVGVRVTKRTTLHGLSLNIHNHFDLFEKIIPCGIKDFGVTSMQKLGCDQAMDNVKTIISDSFVKVMGYQDQSINSLQGLINE